MLAEKNRPENPRKSRYRTRYRILRRQPLKFDKSLCSGQPVGLPERHGSARKIIVDRTRTETGYFGDGLGACDAPCDEPQAFMLPFSKLDIPRSPIMIDASPRPLFQNSEEHHVGKKCELTF